MSSSDACVSSGLSCRRRRGEGGRRREDKTPPPCSSLTTQRKGIPVRVPVYLHLHLRLTNNPQTKLMQNTKILTSQTPTYLFHPLLSSLFSSRVSPYCIVHMIACSSEVPAPLKPTQRSHTRPTRRGTRGGRALPSLPNLNLQPCLAFDFKPYQVDVSVAPGLCVWRHPSHRIASQTTFS